jgi:hypothetical protein
MTRPPQNSFENKLKPNQCEDLRYNGCGVRLRSCNQCGVKTISVPWTKKHRRFTLFIVAFPIDASQAAQSVQAAGLLRNIDWSTAQVIMQRAVERCLERRSLVEGQAARFVRSSPRDEPFVSLNTIEFRLCCAAENSV